MKHCPECGQVIPSVPKGIVIEDNYVIAFGERYRLTHGEARAFECIAERYPRHARNDDIQEAIYGLDSDWPETVASVKVMICTMRKKLAQAPLAVNSVYGQGYRLVLLKDGEQTPKPREVVRWV